MTKRVGLKRHASAQSIVSSGRPNQLLPLEGGLARTGCLNHQQTTGLAMVWLLLHARRCDIGYVHSNIATLTNPFMLRGDLMRVTRSAAIWVLVAAFAVAGTGVLNAQTSMVPYYGKNQIHYDTFDWHT